MNKLSFEDDSSLSPDGYIIYQRHDDAGIGRCWFCNHTATNIYRNIKVDVYRKNPEMFKTTILRGYSVCKKCLERCKRFKNVSHLQLGKIMARIEKNKSSDTPILTTKGFRYWRDHIVVVDHNIESVELLPNGLMAITLEGEPTSNRQVTDK